MTLPMVRYRGSVVEPESILIAISPISCPSRSLSSTTVTVILWGTFQLVSSNNNEVFPDPTTAAPILSNPLTPFGVFEFVVVPSPSWPLRFRPQQNTPALVRAQVWYWPPTISTIPARPPLTSTGVGVSALDPRPRRPYWPSPQHFISPLPRVTQLWA